MIPLVQSSGAHICDGGGRNLCVLKFVRTWPTAGQLKSTWRRFCFTSLRHGNDHHRIPLVHHPCQDSFSHPTINICNLQFSRDGRLEVLRLVSGDRNHHQSKGLAPRDGYHLRCDDAGNSVRREQEW